jgi:hypothetical protein
MKLHGVLVNHVLEVCVPRPVWAARHGGMTAPTSQPSYGTNVRNAANVSTVNVKG